MSEQDPEGSRDKNQDGGRRVSHQRHSAHGAGDDVDYGQDILQHSGSGTGHVESHHAADEHSESRTQSEKAEESELIIDDYDLIESDKNAPVPTQQVKNAPCIVDPNAKKARFSDIDSRQLSWYTQQNLRDRYRISFRFVVMKCLKWLGLCIAAWGGYIYWYGLEGVLSPQSFMQHLQLIGVRLSLAVFLFMILYWEMFRRTLELRIVGFRLVVTHGVLWKIRGSMAIVPIMQITVKQTGLDLLFDLYRVVMWVPGSSNDDDMLTVPGLNRTDAYDFHNFLTIELNRQVFLAGNALEAEDQMRLQEAMEGEDY